VAVNSASSKISVSGLSSGGMWLVIIYTLIVAVNSASSKISVSGLSSGGAMAVQFHIAWSSIVEASAVIAGAPYYCSQGNLNTAITACTNTSSLISISELVVQTNFAYSTRTIDDPRLLANTKVWLYSGKLDTVVHQGVVKKTETYYKNWISASNIQTEYDIDSEHAFITNDYGNACSHLGTPFINNCDYNSVGTFLSFFFGKLNSPVTPKTENIKELDQATYIPVVTPDAAALGKTAFVYIPASCNQQNSGCRVHVAFHGCEQSVADVSSDYYLHTGYLGWAEANNFIVLFPQAKATTLNPKGCWDWWGFTGANFATKLGVQIATVKNMVDHLLQTYGDLESSPQYFTAEL